MSASAEGAADPLPCQDSNNCTEGLWKKLSTNHRKTAAALRWNVKGLCDQYGIGRVGFLTLTFRNHVLDAKEAQRRFHSLRTHVLEKRYREGIRVIERQKSGRIHYHLLVVLDTDIRSGVDFGEFANGIYRSANPALRAEWAFLRNALPKYGFGRHELLPVKSSDEAIASYVGKYIAKHIEQREERDKGVRLVAYFKGAARSVARFSWASPGAKNFRRKLAFLAVALGYSPSNYREKFKEDLGSNWAFTLTPWILRMKFQDYPTGAEAMADWSEFYSPGTNLKDVTNVQLMGFVYDQASQWRADAVMVALDLRKRVSCKRGAKSKACGVGGSSPRAIHGQRRISEDRLCQGGEGGGRGYYLDETDRRIESSGKCAWGGDSGGVVLTARQTMWNIGMNGCGCRTVRDVPGNAHGPSAQEGPQFVGAYERYA